MFGNLHYATLTVMVQTAVALELGIRLVREGKAIPLIRCLRSCGNLYTFGFLLVWVEILTTSYLDLNGYRFEALKNAAYVTGLPILIIALVFGLHGTEVCCRGIFLGMAGYAAVSIGPIIPVMYLDARLQNALVGAERLTTYSQDTINGSLMFFFGTLGFFRSGRA